MKKQALLIGINEYPILPRLNFARQDAEAVEESLKQHYCFSDNEVMLLTDAKPGLLKPINRRVIVKHLEKLADQEFDLFIFGFWGHGLFRNGQRYFCPMDGIDEDIEELGLSFDDLKRLLSNIKAKNTCLILDCCQKVNDTGESETFTAADQFAMENVARDIEYRRQEKNPGFQSNVAVLNSCKEGQSAYEWDVRQHGLFTAHLLDAMKIPCKSISQIASYVSSQIEKTALKLGKEQTPFYKIEGDIQLPVDANAPLEPVQPVRNAKPQFNPRSVVVPDDFATLEEAYDNVTDGGVITIKPGKYELSATIKVNRPVTFRGSSGQPEDAVIHCPVSDAFRIADDSPLFQYLTVSSGAENCNGMFITGGSPRLIRCVITSSQGNGMTVKGKNAGPQVESCTIKDCGDSGVFVEDCGFGSFNDCDFYGNGDSGIQVRQSGNPTVAKCRIHDGKPYGVLVHENGLGSFCDCEIYKNESGGVIVAKHGNPTVSRCIIHDEQGHGVGIVENGLGNFVDCDIYGCSQLGFTAQRFANPTVARCKIHDGKQNGISVSDNGLGSFIDCEIYGNEWPGISVKTQGAPTVARCKIHDGKGTGVYVLKNGLGKFNDCDIYQNVHSGVSVEDSGNPTFTDCKIHDGNVGVSVSDSGLGSFNNCDIYGNAISEIAVITSGNPTVTGCKIHDGKGAGIVIGSGPDSFKSGSGSFNNCEIYGNVKPGIVVTESGNPTVAGCKIHDGIDCGVLVLNKGMGTFNNNALARNRVMPPKVKEILNWIGQGNNSEPKDWDIRSDAGVVRGSGNTPPLPRR